MTIYSACICVYFARSTFLCRDPPVYLSVYLLSDTDSDDHGVGAASHFGLPQLARITLIPGPSFHSGTILVRLVLNVDYETSC
jgi:hypothetical protein